jgi:hypothetical protein
MVSPEVAQDVFPVHGDQNDHCDETTQSMFVGVDDTETDGVTARGGASDEEGDLDWVPVSEAEAEAGTTDTLILPLVLIPGLLAAESDSGKDSEADNVIETDGVKDCDQDMDSRIGDDDGDEVPEAVVDTEELSLGKGGRLDCGLVDAATLLLALTAALPNALAVPDMDCDSE